MASATGLVVGSGLVAFAGNFKKTGGFPANGFVTLTATIILAFVVSFMQDGPLAKPVKAFALLAFIAVLIRYVPGLAKEWANNHG